MKKLKVEYVDIEELKPYINNAKIHTEEQIEQIKKSIQEFGMNDPIAVWKDDEIIEGHGRLEACKELGIEKVPVIRLDELTDEQRKAYMNVHNQLTMNTGFNFDILTEEFESIDSIDMSQFGFKIDQDWFQTRERWEGKQEGNDEYNEFLEQFEIKKTTDDCYTPDEIYEVVANYVEKKYNLNRKNFVRPFYPGGDYEKEKYKDTDIVVDNPPFSILAEIQRFYTDNGIKYFLFCPGLVGLSKTQVECATIIVTSAPVTYENGAKVTTNFTTNLENEYIARTDSKFRKEIEETDQRLQKEEKTELPKYEYPTDVLTLAMMGGYARYGVDLCVEKDQAIRIQKLDAQDEDGNAIYGGGLLLGKKARAEHEKARAEHEKARAEHEKARAEAEKLKPRIIYELSEREKELCKSIGKKGGKG